MRMFCGIAANATVALEKARTRESDSTSFLIMSSTDSLFIGNIYRFVTLIVP